MATDQILQLLISERDKLNQAILALQGTKRRGRPPKSLTKSASPTLAPARKTRTFSKGTARGGARTDEGVLGCETEAGEIGKLFARNLLHCNPGVAE